jgi:hypothetical protein
MVEPTGIEALYGSIHPARLTLARLAAIDGGADRDRTGDLKLAKLALSQLSYGPVIGRALPLAAHQPKRQSPGRGEWQR